MNTDKRRELKTSYKEKPSTGGVYCITCTVNGRRLIKPSVDLVSVKNRFDFLLKIKSCPDPALHHEWTEFGDEAFSFTVLDELNKAKNQSAEDFAADIQALYELQLEKLT